MFTVIIGRSFCVSLSVAASAASPRPERPPPTPPPAPLPPSAAPPPGIEPPPDLPFFCFFFAGFPSFSSSLSCTICSLRNLE